MSKPWANHGIPSRKVTWNLRIDRWKATFLYNASGFGFPLNAPVLRLRFGETGEGPLLPSGMLGFLNSVQTSLFILYRIL